MAHTNGAEACAHIPGLEGKRVLVTGGSAGIGRATVLTFASSGAIVTAAARRPERLDAVMAAAPKGAQVHKVVVDLTSEESCKTAVRDAVSQMGGLDVIVNCGANASDANDKVFDAWASMASLHATGAWLLVQEAEPELKKSGKGAVVNVSSCLGTIPAAKRDMTVYHAMKAAQDMVTKSLALQLAKEGVRVNAVAPGYIASEAIESMAKAQGMTLEEFLAKVGPVHPIGRAGKPEEVANVIAFLASDLASNVTGAIVPVDGGAELTSKFHETQHD